MDAGATRRIALATEVGGEYDLFSSPGLTPGSWAPAWAPVPTGAAQAADGTVAGSGDPLVIDFFLPPPAGPSLYFRMLRHRYLAPAP